MFPRFWLVPLPAVLVVLFVLVWGPSPNTVAITAARTSSAVAPTPVAVVSPWLLTQAPCAYGCTCCASAATMLQGAEADATVKPGKSVSLSLSFSCLVGGPVTSYQWQKDGVDIAGATAATLAISSARHCDQGSYRARFRLQCSPSVIQFSSATDLEISSFGPPSAAPAAVGESGIAAAHVSTEQVLLHSGEMAVSAVDLRIPGRGIDFVWQRTYRSRTGPKDASSGLGVGWDHSYNIKIRRAEPSNPLVRDIVLSDGATRQDRLVYNGTTYTAPELFVEGVEAPTNVITLTFPNKSQWKFFSLTDVQSGRRGKIQTITDRNGNRLAFDYDTLGRLTVVHDTLDTASHQRDIHFNYSGSSLLIQSVVDFAGRTISYEYNTGQDLVAVNSPAVINLPTNGNDFPAGKRTVYTYSVGFTDARLNHNLLTITDGKGQTYLSNVYATTTNLGDINFDRLLEQRLGSASQKLEFYYTCAPQSGDSLLATVNDRAGNVSWNYYGVQNRLLQTRRFTGRAITGVRSSESANLPTGRLRANDPDYFATAYEYNSDSLVTRVTRSSSSQVSGASQTEYTYATAPVRSRANVLSIRRTPGARGGDQAELLETFTYDPQFNFVDTSTDARGGITDRDFDAWGNVIAITHAIPSVFEIFEYDPAIHGQLTARVWPDNGSGQSRRDEYAYFTPGDGPLNGYLKTSAIKQAGPGGGDLVTQYARDAAGNVTAVTDPKGHTTTYEVNSLNQVWRETPPEVTDGAGPTYQITYRFDANDNVIRVDRLNRDETGALDPNRVLTTTTQFDVLNRPTLVSREVEATRNVVTEFQYDDNGNRTLVRKGEATNGHQPANTLLTSYDERDLPFRTTRAPGDPSAATTQYDYDLDGQLAVLTEDPDGSPRVTTSVRDGFGRLRVSTDAMGNVTTRHYDASGNLASEIVEGELHDVAGGSNNTCLAETTYAYDALDRRTDVDVGHFDPATQAPIGDGHSLTHTIYSANSQPVAVIDDSGNTTAMSYDAANRLSTENDARGNLTSYAYDPNSNVSTLTRLERSDLPTPDQVFVTSYTYDNLDRRTSTIDNAGGVRTAGYDSRDNVVLETDASLSMTRHVYDGLDRRIATLFDLDGNGVFGNPGDIVTTSTYDDDSRVTSRTDANGNTTRHAYDALDRLTAVFLADNPSAVPSIVYGYDRHDDVVLETDANGTQTLSVYDALHRPTVRRASVLGAGVAPAPNLETFSYDALSRPTASLSTCVAPCSGAADRIVRRAYDSMGNLLSEEQNGRKVASTFDGLGNRTSLRYPSGRVVSFAFDALDRQKDIQEGSTVLAHLDYFGPARVERVNFANDTRLQNSFDALGRPARTEHLVHPNGAATRFVDRASTWGPTSMRLSYTDQLPGGATRVFTHDRAGRLTASSKTASGAPPFVSSYVLDPAGNRLGATPPAPTRFSSTLEAYTMDPTPLPGRADRQMSQYTTANNRRFTYDANGNLVGTAKSTSATASGGGSPALESLSYDFRDRLVRYVDEQSGQVTTYAYDALGRRVAKTTAGNTTTYVYDGRDLIEEHDASGATLATYVRSAAFAAPLSMRSDPDQNGSFENFFFHADDNQNVLALTNASGALVERYDFTDFGKPAITTLPGAPHPAAGSIQRFLFAGNEFDAESGLYHCGTRYLSPVLGRFLSRDGLGAWHDAAHVGSAATYRRNSPWSVLGTERRTLGSGRDAGAFAAPERSPASD